MPTFKKKILNPRTYVMDGQKVELPTDRFRAWVRNFRRLKKDGYRLPAPFYHDPKAEPVRLKSNQKDVDAFNNGGFWERLWVSKKDGALWGEVEVNDPKKAAKIENKEIVEVSPAIRNEFETDDGKTVKDVLTHIAMVTQPVAGGQEPFEIAASHQFFARSMQEEEDEGGGNWDFSLVQNPTTPTDSVATTGPVTASSATLDDVLRVLESRGLVLPKDTDETNFYERVVTAALAVEGGGQGQMKPQQLPPHTHILSRQEESDMAEENKDGQTDELQQKYDAALNFARDIAVKGIKDRIQALVDSKRCTKELIEEKIMPLVEKHEILFSKDGTVVEGPLDVALAVLEALPVPEKPKEESNPFMPRMVDMSRGQVEEPNDDAGPKLPETPDEIDELINRVPALKARVVG